MNYKNIVFFIFFVFSLGNASLSLAMKPNKKQIIEGQSIIFSGSTGINNFFNICSQPNVNLQTLNSHQQIEEQIIKNTPSIEERIKNLYKLGDISDINILRQELKKWGYDKEAWDKVNTLGAGPTPMMIAQKNNYHACSILLYNYNRSNDPFFQAIMFGNKSKLDEILSKNPKKINEDIVIDNGQCSCLPLSWAITLEDVPLAKYFLEKGAKIDIKTSIGLNPFDEAFNSPEILKLMRNYFDGRRLQRQKDFFEAINKDDTKKMEEIVARNVQSKFDIIREPSGFFTPLKCAVTRGNEKATQYLISNGAFNIPEKDKRELFLHACMSKKIPVIHLLVNEVDDITFYLKEKLNRDCPFNYFLSDEVKQELFALYKKHRTTTDQKLLSLTTKLGPKDLIQQMLDEGVNINGYDSEKMTALLWACSYGNPNSISFLIERGADVDTLDKKGRCCLRKLIRMHKTSPRKQGRQLTTSELLPCLLLLVCHGADKNIKDNEGESPRDWVIKQKFNNIGEKNLISRVFNSDQLSRDTLACLLDDIYAFQCKELEQAQKTCDKQAIYYIERSLVKHYVMFFEKTNKKEYYRDLIDAQLKRQKK